MSYYGAHRYWRLNNITSDIGVAVVLIGELHFYDETNADITSYTATVSSIDGGNVPGRGPQLLNDGDPGTIWASNAPSGQWVSCDFGTPRDIRKLGFQTAGDMAWPQYAPGTWDLIYSDDGTTWFLAHGMSQTGLPYNTLKIIDVPEQAATVATRVTEFFALTAVQLPTENILNSQFYALTAIRFPTIETRASQTLIITANKTVNQMRVSEIAMLVAVKGRTANPRVQAWTFTLDGHDFYVLRLGDKETIIYDVLVKEWIEWDAFGETFWPVLCGINWVGGEQQARNLGSNILVGDDTFGLVWVLDPMVPYDQDPAEETQTQQRPFTREVTGQVVVRGRQAVPCYVIFVTGDNYGIAATDFTAGVTLQISDNAGKTFDPQGTINVTPDTVNLPYEWTSLGQITAPGRLFKIVDNGIFARIDALDMNDAG